MKLIEQPVWVAGIDTEAVAVAGTLVLAIVLMVIVIALGPSIGAVRVYRIAAIIYAAVAVVNAAQFMRR